MNQKAPQKGREKKRKRLWRLQKESSSYTEEKNPLALAKGQQPKKVGKEPTSEGWAVREKKMGIKRIRNYRSGRKKKTKEKGMQNRRERR